MREFNLEKAIAGHPVCTRDGRPVTQLVKFDVQFGICLAGVVDGMLIMFDRLGQSTNAQTTANSRFELFMAPVKKTGWVARYGNDYVWGVFESESEAFLKAPGALSYHEITWEE